MPRTDHMHVPAVEMRPAKEVTTRSPLKILMNPDNGWPKEIMQEGLVFLTHGRRDVVFISDADLIPELLACHDTIVRDPMYRRVFGLGLGTKGVTTTETQHWRSLRHVLAPIFRPAGLSDLALVVSQQTHLFLKSLKSANIEDLQADMNHLTLSVIYQSLFAEAGDPSCPPQIESAARAMADATRRGSMADAIAEIQSVARYAITTPPSAPIIQQNAFAASNPYQLDENELVSNARVLLDAGHETTATSLTWLLFLLGQNSEWQRELRQEIQRVVGSGAVRFENLNQMPLLKATVDEALRLYPSAPIILRRVLKEFDLPDGRKLSKDAHLAMSLYALHRRPDYWDNPDEFNPRRWLEETPKRAYLPFGYGLHKCVGMGMSLMQIGVILTEILRTTEVKTLTDNVRPAMLITLHPDRAVRMEFARISG